MSAVVGFSSVVLSSLWISFVFHCYSSSLRVKLGVESSTEFLSASKIDYEIEPWAWTWSFEPKLNIFITSPSFILTFLAIVGVFLAELGVLLRGWCLVDEDELEMDSSDTGLVVPEDIIGLRSSEL